MGFIAACVETPGAGPALGYPGGESPYYGSGYGRDEELEREWEARQKMRYTCENLRDRIRFDRDKIASIDPSKHPKALQWYRDDLANADRDRERCGYYGDSGGYGDSEGWRERRREDEERRREDAERARENAERGHEQCAKIAERIRYDRDQIATIDPSKHPKARQWYKDDLVNAERDLQRCGR